MTWGRGRFGPFNAMLLAAAVLCAVLFLRTQARSASPLVRLDMLRDPRLAASLAMSVLVMTVMMATLVVGPFHLSRALGLGTAAVGLAVSVGPLVAALAGVPAGRLVDRVGAQRVTCAGLGLLAGGCVLLASLPMQLGVAGYVAPLALVTLGFSLFQTANNTGVMAGIEPGQRGLVSGMLQLARNLGLVTGASLMGAVFALGSAAQDVTTAAPAAVARGMRVTFAVAAALVVLALATALASRARAARASSAGEV